MHNDQYAQYEVLPSITGANRETLVHATQAVHRCVPAFRASPVLLKEKRSIIIEKTKQVMGTDVASSSRGYSTSSKAKHLNYTRPRPTGEHTFRIGRNTALFNSHIPEQYDTEKPSVFEQALARVEKGSQLACDWVVSLPSDNPAHIHHGHLPKRQTHLSKTLSTDTATSDSPDRSKVHDEDVFKGLDIAMTAACDEKYDSRMQELHGYSIRKLLSNLTALDALGPNSLTRTALRTAKKRAAELQRELSALERAMEDDRQRKEMAAKPRGKDRRLGLVAVDEPSYGELVGHMHRRKWARADERLNERAVTMGWRERGVSAGC